MASIISVDTLQDSAGSNEITTANVKTAFDDRVKAWVNFNGTGTIATRDSLNVSSLTDSGTGQYGTNFTSSFINGDYSAMVNTENDGNSGHVGTWNTGDWAMATRSNSTNSLADETFVCVSIHGDLA